MLNSYIQKKAGYPGVFTRVLQFMGLVACLSLQTAAPLAQDSGVVEREMTPGQRLESLLAGISSFRARVNQLIVESTGGVLEESDILFMLKRPDGFYWETLAPFPELLVTNGDKLWNYQPDLLQLTIEDWDPAQAELAAQLFNGQYEEIAEDYEITAQSAAQGRDWEFFLDPLDPGSIYERVTLYFADGVIDSIHIDNGNGQKTLWQFYEKTLNADIADEQFVFTPPDDVEIIDNSL